MPHTSSYPFAATNPAKGVFQPAALRHGFLTLPAVYWPNWPAWLRRTPVYMPKTVARYARRHAHQKVYSCRVLRAPLVEHLTYSRVCSPVSMTVFCDLSVSCSASISFPFTFPLLRRSAVSLAHIHSLLGLVLRQPPNRAPSVFSFCTNSHRTSFYYLEHTLPATCYLAK